MVGREHHVEAVANGADAEGVERRDVAVAAAANHHLPHYYDTNVVSGEESEDIFPEDLHREYGLEYGEGTDEDEDDREIAPESASNGDDFYDETLDGEDEAYVYKNLRGGVREHVTIIRKMQDHSSTEGSQREQQFSGERKQQHVQVYKPRNSDAVLSCPCCFNIVCMDCQRHSKYHNQFRAIFVMGIAVDWQKILVHDPVQQTLIPKEESTKNHQCLEDIVDLKNQSQQHHHAVPPTESSETIRQQLQDLSWLDEPVARSWTPPPTNEGEYFAVECAGCRTHVAALDMREEVYYFHGCLESSAPS